MQTDNQILFWANQGSIGLGKDTERENGRSGNEGNLRPGSSGCESDAMQPATSNTSSSMTTGMASTLPILVLAGSRQFSCQLPTILQSIDDQDERGSNYEENFNGS
ncbi:hypothetical protein NE237_028401 [Protea cynaroides]|uniref:Uncharacterized protein n=1 Tax=Protea cynaroides TaxID=273540 RepID=A0A9Q0GQ99_9MAGN|nr:hypothetical protein NE237_028401 [Protea cynaroides]